MTSSAKSILKAGVVGAGVFGRFHAQKYKTLPGVELVSVFDKDPMRAQSLSKDLRIAAFSDWPSFLEGLDLISVSSPASTHALLGGLALEAGISTYIEKPLATDLLAAESLVIKAKNQGCVLACGHQERVIFNAMGLFTIPEIPKKLTAIRHGLPNTRNQDVSCVLDLMIHDLDLALCLGKVEIAAVKARGDRDQVMAQVSFKNGLEAEFSASRKAQARDRRMSLIYETGEIFVDFLAPSFVNKTNFALDAEFHQQPESQDPLGTSLAAFVAAVQARKSPIATGEDGLQALSLALAIEAEAGIDPHIL